MGVLSVFLQCLCGVMGAMGHGEMDRSQKVLSAFQLLLCDT